jgi:hypothetical protein
MTDEIYVERTAMTDRATEGSLDIDRVVLAGRL